MFVLFLFLDDPDCPGLPLEGTLSKYVYQSEVEVWETMDDLGSRGIVCDYILAYTGENGKGVGNEIRRGYIM